jgi:hypothetical protein
MEKLREELKASKVQAETENGRYDIKRGKKRLKHHNL